MLTGCIVGASTIATDGATPGEAGVSSDWSPACACAWHSAGCSMSTTSSQPIMLSCSEEVIVLTSAVPVGCRLGQAYAATASCMNSTLNSAMSAVANRERRVSFIEISFRFKTGKIRSGYKSNRAFHLLGARPKNRHHNPQLACRRNIDAWYRERVRHVVHTRTGFRSPGSAEVIRRARLE